MSVDYVTLHQAKTGVKPSVELYSLLQLTCFHSQSLMFTQCMAATDTDVNISATCALIYYYYRSVLNVKATQFQEIPCISVVYKFLHNLDMQRKSLFKTV